MRVSVVIITYNQRDLVAETLDSVLAQTGVDLQVVVADDGSRDGTREIIAGYAQRHACIVPVLSEVNTGIAGNFNRGLRAVDGELVCWLGGDDVMLPGKLARQVAVLQAEPGAIGCFHDAEVFEHPGNRVLGRFFDLYGSVGARDLRIDAHRFLLPATQMLPSSIMVRRSAIPAHGFDERFRVLNDYLFDFETLVNGGWYAGIPEVLVRYRKHAGSIGASPAMAKLMHEEKQMVCAVIMARYPRHAAAARYRAAYYAMESAVKALREDDRDLFRARCRLAALHGQWLRATLVRLVAPMGLALFYGPRGQSLRGLARRLFFRSR